MAIKDKTTLKSDVATVFPDNNTEDISPEDLRLQQDDAIDSDLNLAELTQQTVAGQVEFLQSIIVPAASVQIGPTQKLSDIGSVLGITDIARDTLSTIITSGTTGVTVDDRPVWANSDIPEMLLVQGDDSENFVGKALSWTVTALIVDFTRTTSVIARGGSATTNLRVVIKLDDALGNVVFKSHADQLWEAGAGFTLNAAGDSTFDFLEGFVSRVGETYFITWEVPASAPDVTIKGFDSGGGLVPYQDVNLQRGVLETLGDMEKSVYDTNDIGIVDGSQKITDFAVLDEDVTQGDMLYIVDAPLSPEGFPTLGIADSDSQGKQPAVAGAAVSGLMGATIKVIQDGFLSGIDTSAFSVNEVVYLSRDGKITTKTKKFRQEVGIIKDSDASGSILFRQGTVIDHGKLLGYAVDAGGISTYSSTPEFGGSVRRQVFQEVGPNQPQAMVTTAIHIDEIQQPIKIANLINPSFTLTPALNNNILGFILEAATTINNVIMEVFAGPTLIWQNNIGTLVADVETSFSLISDERIPIDLFAGVPYLVVFSSDDGDVVLKGTVGGDPFYALTWDDFIFEDLVSSGVQQRSLRSTGVIFGLEATQDSATEILVSNGEASVGDNAAPANPLVFDVVWTDGLVPQTVTTIGTDGQSVITLNRNGLIEFTLIQNVSVDFYRDNARIGFVNHAAGAIISVFNIPLLPREVYHQMVDFWDALGVFNMGGFEITPTVTGFATGSGELMNPGAGKEQDNRRENVIEIVAQTPLTTFQEFLGKTNTITQAATQVMNVTQYDDGSGSLVDIPGANQAVIKYLFLFPTMPDNISVMHGQVVYSNLQDAIDNADLDFVAVQGNIPEPYASGSVLLARWAVEDGGDLSDPGEAQLLPGSIFGTRIGAGAGAGGGGGGDVFGPVSSVTNEIPTYSDATGKIIEATSDVSIFAGTIDRITANEDLWLRVDTSQENVIIGRHIDFTGVPNLNNTTLLITANSTNDVIMSTLGNNSQSIAFVKSGVFRGQVNNNRDRNSVGLQNAIGDYIEIRPDGDVYHNDRSISATKAYAEDTAANTVVTTLPGSNSYAQCDFGPNFVERIAHGFTLSGSRFQNTGPAFKGVVTFSVDIANSAGVDILYDLRISINDTTNLVGIWRQLFVFPGKPSHALVDAYVELATNDFVQLNIKQPNGALFNPTLRRNTLKIE